MARLRKVIFMAAVSHKKVAEILAEVMVSVDKCEPGEVKEKIWSWLEQMPENLEDLVMDKLGYPKI